MKNSLFYIVAAFIILQLLLNCSKPPVSENRINKLITKLETRDWQAAVDSLADIGTPAIAPLIEIVLSNDPTLDWPAARACYPLARHECHGAK